MNKIKFNKIQCRKNNKLISKFKIKKYLKIKNNLS